MSKNLARKGNDDAVEQDPRYCRECRRVHATLSEELAAHGDPGS